MNSNKSNLTRTPAYIEFGIKFGVRDSTGKIKPEIIDYFLLSKILKLQDLKNGFLLAPNKSSEPYKLTVDKKLKELILKESSATTIISFQRTDTGNFAVARLFEASRTKLNKKELIK